MNKNLLFSLAGIALFGQSSLAQISFTNRTSLFTTPNYSGVTIVVTDVNGDKLDDIVRLNQGTNLNFQVQKLDGAFTAQTIGAVSNESQWGMAAADVTGNGKIDVVAGGSYDNLHYAKANASGTTYTITDLDNSQLFLQACSFADIDNDGDVDFFGCHDDGPSRIYTSDGNGNLTYNATIINTAPFSNGNANNNSGNYGNVWSDFDDDGDVDLYIAHCRQGVNSPTDPRRINMLFLNNGNGTYTEAAANYNLAFGAQSWSADFGDIDNDGDLDCFITNHDVAAMLLENVNNQFVDIYGTSGITNMVGFPLQSIFKDLDNDGFLDIIVSGDAHKIYRNNGNKTFTAIANPFDNNTVESFAVGDLNHDGFLDIYAGYAQIYTTPSNTPDALWMNNRNTNNWIAFDLEGTVSNKNAIGAKIKLYSSLGVQVREVRAGESYGIQNSFTQHFGLGQVTNVDSVVIHFPSGIVNKLYDLEPGQFVTVVENQCSLSNVFVASSNPGGVLCAGQSLTLTAPAGYSYLWSNNSTSQSVNVSSTGTYMVRVTNTATGCSATSASFDVIVAPDETPSVSANGDLEICEGSPVVLTSTSASSYAWNNGGNTESVTVTQPGEYTVTIQGVCGQFTSAPISVTQLSAPAPTVDDNDVYIPIAGTANLTANGSNLTWYDQATGGNVLGTGSNFTTPVVTAQNTFYVEELYTYGGGVFNGGRVDNSGTGAYQNNSSFYLVFDVLEECTLNSVKVYANGAGNRTIRLHGAGGAQLQEAVVNIPDGESRIDLNFQLTPGTGYSLRTVGDPQLWRNAPNAPMSYPYAVGNLANITGTNVTGANTYNYYYYFYDWEVEAPAKECVSARTPVTVTVGFVGVEAGELSGASVYPNPTEGLLNVNVPASVKGQVNMAVYNTTGQQVMSSSLNSGVRQLDLSGLASGIYTVQLRSANGQANFRVAVR